jgi:hypothetical protein
VNEGFTKNELKRVRSSSISKKNHTRTAAKNNAKVFLFVQCGKVGVPFSRALMDGGASSSSGVTSAARRAERTTRRERERRRKGAEKSDEAFGGDDVAVRLRKLSACGGLTRV